LSWLAARDRRDDPHLSAGADRRRQVTLELLVHERVHERPQVAAFVEEEVRDRQRAECVAERRRVDLEPVLPAGLRREQAGDQNLGYGAASTERIGGSCDAASTQVPSRVESAKSEPLWVPR
jgi:hypothetical protein